MGLSCAGKVFVTGEYSCIEGGPALICTVAPDFALEVVPDATTPVIPLHHQSPAGIYLSRHLDVLEGKRVEWIDPYTTPIGVGSSSAQFLLSVAAVHALRGEPPPDAQAILNLYWDTVGESQGLRPSGVDVVAQWLGGPLVARNSPFMTRSLPVWKNDSVFILAYTGRKARTHEALKALAERGFPRGFQNDFARLDEITLGAIEAWEKGDARVLGSALNAYQHALMASGIAPVDFTSELEAIQSWPGVHGCKGSGAQGGDCVLLLVEARLSDVVLDQLRARGWDPIVARWTHSGITRES